MEKEIFTMWWQGEESAPPLVKACIKSIRKYAGDAEVIVVDKFNYKDYVNVPENILQKFKNGKISVTHFSDFIRVSLLLHRGGMWIDSTVLVTCPIADQLFKSDFYTIRYNVKQDSCIAKKRWAIYLMAGSKQCVIFKYLYNYLCAWWAAYDDVADYLLTDFIIDYIYDKHNEVKELIDSVSNYSYDVFKLSKHLNSSAQKDLSDFGVFNKLTYKKSYKLRVDNKPTYYYTLLNYYGESFQSKKVHRVRLKIKEIFRNLKIKRIKQFGLKLCLYNFLKCVAPLFPSRFRSKFMVNYNKFISKKIKLIFNEIIKDS